MFWFGTKQATSLYVNHWRPSSLTHRGDSRPHWFKQRHYDYFAPNEHQNNDFTQFRCIWHNTIIFTSRKYPRKSLRWRHNDHAGVSNHQPPGCLLNRLFRRKSKKTSKAPRHWPLCGKFTGDRWIFRTNGQLRGKCFHLMTSSCVTETAGHLFAAFV